METQL